MTSKSLHFSHDVSRWDEEMFYRYFERCAILCPDGEVNFGAHELGVKDAETYGGLNVE